MSTVSQNSPPPQPVVSVPDLKLPISRDPGHPVNSQGVGVYFSRTDNLVGLPAEKQVPVLVEAMRGVGPGKVMLFEASGPRNGSYTDELGVALPAALQQIPADQRPEIRLFISDGRPVIGNPKHASDPIAPNNDFTTFLQGLEEKKKGSGIVAVDNSQTPPRAIPNWNNPEVVDFYLRERVQPAIDLAKKLGVKQVLIDDHIGVPGAQMDDFKKANGFKTDAQAQKAITGAYARVLDTIQGAGLQSGLSTAADPVGNLKFGIDMARLAPKADTVEIQGYRQTPKLLGDMTNNLYDNISRNFEQYRDVKEIKIALVTRANGVDLSPDVLKQQQKGIDDFEKRIGTLYRSKGLEPPQVSTSLWAHQNFYQDPLALRVGQQGPRVKELQESLNEAGITVKGKPLATTGVFDQETKQAVSQYQRQAGLAISGEADKHVLLSLGIHPRQKEQSPQLQSASPATPENGDRQLITHRDHPGNKWLEQAHTALSRTPEGQQMNDETRIKAAAWMAYETMASGRIGKIESAEVLPGGAIVASDRATTREIDARLANADMNGLESMTLREISQKVAELPEASRNRAPEPLSDANAVARHQQTPQEQLGNPTLAQDTRPAPRLA
jgi:hypothetical protein